MHNIKIINNNILYLYNNLIFDYLVVWAFTIVVQKSIPLFQTELIFFVLHNIDSSKDYGYSNFCSNLVIDI